MGERETVKPSRDTWAEEGAVEEDLIRGEEGANRFQEIAPNIDLQKQREQVAELTHTLYFKTLEEVKRDLNSDDPERRRFAQVKLKEARLTQEMADLEPFAKSGDSDDQAYAERHQHGLEKSLRMTELERMSLDPSLPQEQRYSAGQDFKKVKEEMESGLKINYLQRLIELSPYIKSEDESVRKKATREVELIRRLNRGDLLPDELIELNKIRVETGSWGAGPGEEAGTSDGAKDGKEK